MRDGSIGAVVGKRGGLAPGFMPPNLVSVDALEDVLETLVPGDRIVLEAEGRGLSFLDLPEIGIFNLSAAALDACPSAARDGGLECAVKAVVPVRIAGAGVGQSPWIGDVEIAGDEVLAGDLAASSLRRSCRLQFDGRQGQPILPAGIHHRGRRLPWSQPELPVTGRVSPLCCRVRMSC